MIGEITLQTFPGIFARVLGMMIILPISHNLSGFGKVFTLSFAASLYFVSIIETGIAFNYLHLPLEFLIGCIIALPAALTIEGVRMLAELFDNQRGVAFASLYDPVNNRHDSVMAHIAGNFCLVILISAGLLENIFTALLQSFQNIPLYGSGSEFLGGVSINITKYVSGITTIFFQSFLICAVIFILIDLASVFISKILTGSGLQPEVFLVKTIVGIFLILAIIRVDLTPTFNALALPRDVLLTARP